MVIQFQIEHVTQIKDDPYVIAKMVSTSTYFHLTGINYLGEIEIKNEMMQPRAIDSEGKPRFDLYIFRPKYKNQISEFKVGKILELIIGFEIQFLEPWYKTDIDLTAELKKELNKGHILYNKAVKTIGRRQDNDDVLFEVENSDFRYAMVHLTWSEKQEPLPCPWTITYMNDMDVFNNLILKDHEDWDKKTTKPLQA